METRNQNFMEIGRKLSKDNCEIDTFRADFCDMIFLLDTFTTSSVKMASLVVFTITAKNEICHMYCVA